MQKTILITGATDGIGLETAKLLVSANHHVLLHGRNPEKLASVEKTLSGIGGSGLIESYVADLVDMQAVDAFALDVTSKHDQLDVLINNAGIFKTPETVTKEGFDVRFMVNTFAPYRLTQQLLPLMKPNGRILNLSSAAQAPVSSDAMRGKMALGDMEAYSMSKLAITMWSQELAKQNDAPIVIAVNPGSMLGTKMVKEAFGSDGHDIAIGANILVQLALDDEFANASGQYFDNDARQFNAPHADAQNLELTTSTVQLINEIVNELTSSC